MNKDEQEKRRLEEEQLKQIFSSQLKHVRTERGVKQEVLTRETGISVSNYSKYENAVTLPGLLNAAKIAKYLNVSLDGLCGRGEGFSYYLELLEALERVFYSVKSMITFDGVELGKAETINIKITDSTLATYFLKAKHYRSLLANRDIDREEFDTLMKKAKDKLRTTPTKYEKEVANDGEPTGVQE